MVQQLATRIWYGFDRLQEDSGVLSEESAYPMQNIGSGKAFP